MMRTRFAPSPTGLLHLGTAFSALTAFEAAREADGEMLLRIEDIDQIRCRPEFEDAIYEDLAWLGLEWPAPVRRQSDHFADYAGALKKLIDIGVVYRCFRTRKEVMQKIALAPHLNTEGPEGPVFVSDPLPEAEEKTLLEAGNPFAWRLNMMAAKDHLGLAWGDLAFTEKGSGPNGETGAIRATPEIFGNLIIARKDVGTSYHIACVHDDAMQEITQVVRGHDLFHAAHLHRLLQVLLDLPAPIYRHHPLITDENGKKFSKRDKSATLRSKREEGMTPSEVIEMFLRLTL